MAGLLGSGAHGAWGSMGLRLHGAEADRLCHLQGDVGPPGPKGATGFKGEQVSVGSVGGRAGDSCVP